MKKVRGFTLIELLVVVGIIAILVSILLPVLSHMRRVAAINAEKLDFQAIDAALENYRADFGDYPRNLNLSRWNSTANGNPPTFWSLGIALMGPGNVVAQNNQIGDGADGFGFRSQARAVAVSAPSSVGGTSVTSDKDFETFTNGLSWITFEPGTNNEESILVLTHSGTTPTFTLTLASSVQVTHASTAAVLKTAVGKVWGPYLQPDKFKLQQPWPTPWLTPPSSNIGQPVLLDRWGAPIQYFTRFGPNGNRTADAKGYAPGTPDTTVLDGPLLGNATPLSIDTTNGLNAMWDSRDFTFPTNPNGATDYTLAPRWMLGDDNLDNVIKSPETLRYDGPYILISAGPDTDPALSTARFCNFSGVPASQYDSTFRASGNIYNFDR